MFSTCLGSNFPPHWGNTCPKIAEHLRTKRSVAAQARKDANCVSSEERQLAFQLQHTPKDDFIMPSIQGYNSWPYNSGKECYESHAVLDTGANSTYINNRRLLENISRPSAQAVIVADGSTHPIEASGTLLGFPSIQADLVPTFKKNS